MISDFTFTFHFHALEKEMATRSSVLAWRIPGTGEPGGLLSLGSHRIGHNWSNLVVVLVVVYYYIFILLLLYWSIVDLQCCGNFCSAVKWVYAHSFFYKLFSYGLWLSISVLHSRTLFIHSIYESLHLLTPARPSPLATPVCSLSVFLF